MRKKKAQCSSYDLHRTFLSFAVMYKRGSAIFGVVSLIMENAPFFPRYPAPVLLRHLAEHPAGIARSDHPGWDILRDHASSPDDGPVPDGNAAADSGIGSDPDVTANGDRR